MTGPLPRRLLLWFIGLLGIALLALIVVCVAMQIQVPWQVLTLQSFAIKNYRLFPVKNNNISQDFQPSTANEVETNEVLEQNSAQRSDVQDSSALENNAKSDQLNPNVNFIKPVPKTEAKPIIPDFFGDQYATDEVPLQTNCPTSIRKRVHQSPFADKFLHSIPVLQWAKHFTTEEYQRLSHYAGAHGWGSVDVEVLKSSLRILNTTANHLMFDDWESRTKKSECISCAVVGNGGILNGSRKGTEIDAHDYVFRVNGAAINGFENDVGSRTSFYTFSTNTMRNSMRSYAKVGYRGPPISKETRYIFLPDHDRDYILMKAASTHTVIEKGPERSNKPPKYFGEDVTVEKFKIYHPDFIRYLRNRFLRSNLLNTGAKKIYRPSTGAVMLFAAIHTCDQVDAYGFMTPDYNLYSDHYYDKVRHPVHFYANHDMRMEMKLWQKLHEARLIKLFMRT